VVVQAARYPHGPDAVAEVAFELAEDGRRGEGGEGDPARGVEAVDRVQQAEVGDLEEVVEGLAGAAVALGEAVGERQMTADQLLADGRVLPGREARPELLLTSESKLRVRFGSPGCVAAGRQRCLPSPPGVPKKRERINGEKEFIS
jgi:hypothetical protein